jgi:hypothetical protein
MSDDGKINLSDVPGLGDQFLTVLCHRDEIQVVNDCPNILSIDPESTLAMAAKFTDRTWDTAKHDEDFKRRLGIIFPDLDITKDPRSLAEYPIGYRHVVGLIIMTNKAINTGLQPYWVYPETYLHPASQARLADLAISYKDWYEKSLAQAAVE